MTVRRWRTNVAAAVLAGAGLLAGPAAAQAPTGSASGVDGRLDNVQRLVESSSGARQVEASGTPRALEAREEARGLLARARQAHASGDDDRRPASYTHYLEFLGVHLTRWAVRLAGAPSSIREKKQRDFKSIDDSVTVLLEALERIGKEKGVQGTTSDAAARVRALQGEAQALRDAGDLDRGRASLDMALDTAKRAIEVQRGGETLVRSLNFATKEDEYHYELDRNDTHRMLVDVLVKEKRSKAGIDRMVTTFTDRAQKLRGDAERQAGTGDFAGAVTTLEKSTKEYIRAIRSTGIYIPG